MSTRPARQRSRPGSRRRRPGGRRARRHARRVVPGPPARAARLAGGGLRCRLGGSASRQRRHSAPGLGGARPGTRPARRAPGRRCRGGRGLRVARGAPTSAKDLTLVATLAGLAAAGRVLFAPIPSVQPVTVIVAAAGLALGPRRGFAVGAVAALASNSSSARGRTRRGRCWRGEAAARRRARAAVLDGRLPFAAFCVALGFAYGTLLDLWKWYAFWPHTSGALGVRARRGLRLQRRACGREPRAGAWPAGRSFDECSRATAPFERPRWSGHEAVRARPRLGHRRGRPGRRRGAVPRVASGRGRRLRRGRSGRRPVDDRVAALALVAADGSAEARDRARGALAAAEPALQTQTDLALNALARSALGEPPAPRSTGSPPRNPVRSSTRRSGRSSHSARAAGPRRPRSSAHFAARSVPPAAGSWLRTGAADSNDTAAAIQALRAAGVSGRPVERGLAYLRRGRGTTAASGSRPDGRRTRSRRPGRSRRSSPRAASQAQPPGASSRASAATTAATATASLRDDAGMGDRAGRAGARRQAVPAQALVAASSAEGTSPGSPSPLPMRAGRWPTSAARDHRASRSGHGASFVGDSSTAAEITEASSARMAAVYRRHHDGRCDRLGGGERVGVT